MTDREILELLLQKMNTLENKVSGIEGKVSGIEGKVSGIEEKMATKEDVQRVKRQLMESTAKLKGMDELILDEVERVHEILDRHKDDKTVHTA